MQFANHAAKDGSDPDLRLMPKVANIATRPCKLAERKR
jgi:hypothetical protein